MSQLGTDTLAYIAGLFDGEGCVIERDRNERQ